MSSAHGNTQGTVRRLGRWAAGAGARRRASRQDWHACDPSERSWDSLAAASTMAGWLGPIASGNGRLAREAERERRTAEYVDELPAPAVIGVTRRRPLLSWSPIVGFRPVARRLPSEPDD